MKIELNEQQLNVVLAGLQELPHKHSDSVIRAIIEQVQNQQQQEKEKGSE